MRNVLCLITTPLPHTVYKISSWQEDCDCCTVTVYPPDCGRVGTMYIFCGRQETVYSNCVEIPGTRKWHFDYEYKDSDSLLRVFADARRRAVARLRATAKTFDKWGFN